MNLLKLSNKLLNISYMLRYKATYFELKYYVKKAITENKSYLKPSYPHMRGIGKSYALIELALKYNLPIFVPTKSYENNIQDKARHEFHSNKLKTIVANEDSLRGRRLNVALIEELIPQKLIDESIIPICKNIVGYVNRF